MKKKTISLITCVGLSTAVSATAAWGQEQASSASPSSQLDEIIVTAQRRSERLQDVPISVSVVSSAQLAARGIEGAMALGSAVPGLVVTMQGISSTPYLRGVGSNLANPNNETSVAFYLDGYYQAAPFGNLLSYNNVDRIEVLKGPQGTLFGRNATGGVIQVITRDPSHNSSFEGSIGYGNYNTFRVNGYATGGLSETLAVDLAVQYRNQADGFGRNIFLGIDTRKHREFSIRSKALFTPTDRTRIVASVGYADSRDNDTDFQLQPGTRGIDGLVRNLRPLESENDVATENTVKQNSQTLRIEQELDFATLVSLTGHHYNKARYLSDSDGTSVNVATADLRQSVNNFSQELQLVSLSGNTLRWVLGAYYYKNTAKYDPGYLSGLAFPAPLVFYGRQKTTSKSLFAQTTWEVAPQTSLTGGFRYTWEDQSSLNGTAVQGTPLAKNIRNKTNFRRPTWRLSLEHKWTPEVLTYISYNRGVKSGGLAILLADPTDAGFKPEVLDAFEAGIKSELFGRKLRLNAAAFYYDYRELQVTVNPLGIIRTLNAGKALIKGADLDMEAVLLPGFTLSGGVSYLDAKFTDYPNPVFYPPSIGDPPVLVPGNNAKGYRLPRAPKWTANLSASYQFQALSGEVAISGTLSYNSGFFWEADQGLAQPEYTLVNASAGWRSADERFGIMVWGKNLTDKRYLTVGVPAAVGRLQVYGKPRTYGVTLSTKI